MGHTFMCKEYCDRILCIRFVHEELLSDVYFSKVWILCIPSQNPTFVYTFDGYIPVLPHKYGLKWHK
jgi:hypothetical protein